MCNHSDDKGLIQRFQSTKHSKYLFFIHTGGGKLQVQPQLHHTNHQTSTHNRTRQCRLKVSPLETQDIIWLLDNPLYLLNYSHYSIDLGRTDCDRHQRLEEATEERRQLVPGEMWLDDQTRRRRRDQQSKGTTPTALARWRQVRQACRHASTLVKF